MQQLLVILDRAFLDKPTFVRTFARKLRNIKNNRIIILHSDNSFTKQLVESGMDSYQAQLRATKEISVKMVNFLADYGLPIAVIHGYHRNAIIKKADGTLSINKNHFLSQPESVISVCSNLIFDEASQTVQAMDLGELATALHKELQFEQPICFAHAEDIKLTFKEVHPSPVDLLNWVPEELTKAKATFKMIPIKDLDEKNMLELSQLI